MKASYLRNAVLQLAVQGKLVPQNPDDEPAIKLLTKIRNQKEQLIKEGKVRKGKALPTITDDEKPFEIPDSWEMVRIGEIINLIGGYAFKSTYFSDEGIRVLRISDFDEKLLKVDNMKKYPYSKKLEQYRVQENDIVIAMTGGTVGKTLKIKSLEYNDIYLNQRVGRIRSLLPNKEHINYLFNIISSQYIKTYIKGNVNSTNDNISNELILNTIVPLPPLAEQQRINSKIEEILPKIDEYEKLEQELSLLEGSFSDNLKKSILQYAVQGKLVQQDSNDVPASVLLGKIKAEKEQLIKEGKIKKEKEKALPDITDDEKPFELPKGWEWVRLGGIIKEKPRNGYSPKAVEKVTKVKNLTLTATTSGKFKPDCFKYIDETISDESYLWLEPGDILIQRSNSLDYVGTSCIYTGQPKTYIYPDLMMKIQLFECIQLQYIQFVLSSSTVREYYRSSASGTSESMPKINQSIVNNTLVPLPPIAEQQRIVDKVEKLMSLCDMLNFG
ncbi:restriction endonuclease subunit S [Desulfosporosinus sp. FKB]|uniref:restriction endonuclease subunit S n=1 Tax=Desulfosporosinus sp. FKB TaxID=1969835 RepID=UPI000B49EDC7|nr:restriction endonuclease subunit S [Desulfosporosinus sp. FKB]